MKPTSKEASLKLRILPECYNEIMFYVEESNVEVSGMGRIEIIDGEAVVTKVYLLEQVNGPASTDIDPEALANLMYESRDDKGSMNFWWHSHVNMQVFWSGTDMDTIEQIGKNGYVIATVFNKKKEYRSAFYQGANDFTPTIFVDDITTSFGAVVLPSMKETWKKQLNEKAKETKSYGFGKHEWWMPERKDYSNTNLKDNTATSGPVITNMKPDATGITSHEWPPTAESIARFSSIQYWDVLASLGTLLANLRKRTKADYKSLTMHQQKMIFDLYFLLHGSYPEDAKYKDEGEALFLQVLYDPTIEEEAEEILYYFDDWAEKNLPNTWESYGDEFADESQDYLDGHISTMGLTQKDKQNGNK